jgi:alanyl-tRNA synthetase
MDTVDQGLQILADFMEDVKKSGGDTLEGPMVFRLHDTYGFPYELTEEIASENGLNVDRK